MRPRLVWGSGALELTLPAASPLFKSYNPYFPCNLSDSLSVATKYIVWGGSNPSEGLKLRLQVIERRAVQWVLTVIDLDHSVLDCELYLWMLEQVWKAVCRKDVCVPLLWN